MKHNNDPTRKVKLFIIVKDDDRFDYLLVQRTMNTGADRFEPVGGTVEKNESARQALSREVYQEIRPSDTFMLLLEPDFHRVKFFEDIRSKDDDGNLIVSSFYYMVITPEECDRSGIKRHHPLQEHRTAILPEDVVKAGLRFGSYKYVFAELQRRLGRNGKKLQITYS